MFGDYQARTKKHFFSPSLLRLQRSNTRAVFIQPTKSHFIHPICSASCSSWNKFDKYFSFWNKAHVVPGEDAGVKLVHFDVCVQMIGAHVGNERRYVSGRTCGCAVPNTPWLLVSILPAMFSSSLLESTWSSPAVQLGCGLCIGWDRGSSWVNLNMSVLWQAGLRMIRCLNCVSSTLRHSHQKAVFNRQFCSALKVVQQTENYVAERMTESEHPDVFLQGPLISSLFYGTAMNTWWLYLI